MNRLNRPNCPTMPTLFALVLPLLVTSAAHAAVTHAGTWPSEEKPVTLDLHAASESDALNQLADAAGWSLVTRDLTERTAKVDLHVKKESPSELLDLLLADGNYVATREGNLVSLSMAPGAPVAPIASAAIPAVPAIASAPLPPLAPLAPVAPLAPLAPLPPAAASTTTTTNAHARRGEDRTVAGGALRIDVNDVVRDVSVLGGALDVYGEVTGDVSVLGGSVHLHDGARVDGSANVIGGRLLIDKGAEVNGDVGVLGGNVVREPGSKVHGSITGIGDDDNNTHEDDDDDEPNASDAGAKAGAAALHKHVDDDDDDDDHDKKKSWASRAAESIGHGISHASLLFVLGAILIALAPRKLDLLRTEIAARPARSFALGVAGALAGSLLLIMLCVTVIGIPLAALLACAAPVAALLGLCVLLTTAGGAILNRRTENPYAHLALGCGIFLVVGFLPLGGLVHVVAAIIGFGAVVGTRAAGLWPTPSPKI